MGLHENSLPRVLFAQQRGFPRIAGENRVGVVEQLPRLQHGAENFAPVPAARSRLVKGVLQAVGQVQQPAMNGGPACWESPLKEAAYPLFRRCDGCRPDIPP